jgi:hypothetical protein
MWGAAPRFGRVAALLALAAGVLAFAGSASAATNWAGKASADFDGDHVTDFGSLYRGRSPQDGLWYAPGTAGGGPFQIYFGATTDVPVPGDYDGDGKTDAAIFRPSTGLWYGPRTGGNTIVIQMILGQSGDVPVPGDYDGDGKTDPAIYRPSSGLFFAVLSGGGTLGTIVGQGGDVPVPADYDGDGKTDPAVYRPSTGQWTAQLSGGGTYQATNGAAGDVPVPADYNGDGRADPVVFHAATGAWTGPFNGAAGSYSRTLGQAGDVPIPGYYDNNLAADPGVFRASSGTWLATLSGGGSKRFDGLGLVTDVPVQERPTLPVPATAPANTAPPAISGTAQGGLTLTASTGSWSGTTPMSFAYQWRRCDSAGANCADIAGATGSTYVPVGADTAHTLRVLVTATNGGGSAPATSAQTGLVHGEYFTTLPVGSALPRTDADCASRVTRNPWEPRPENYTANHTVPDGPVPWNNNPSWTYWSSFIALRNKVTGNFTGTTDEIIQWAACKWGIEENLIRAEAVLESYWVQSTQGDFANGRYHSFGLMQVSQDDPNGNLLKGGYPYTAQDTALNVDYYGSELRACFEGDFWDGGGWLYGATQVKGDIWGCVGYWYSGNWYDAGAQNYIAQVKNYYNTKPWIGWGYPGK